MLDGKLHRKLVQALATVPDTATVEGRNALLAGLPPNVTASLNRSNGRLTDLSNIITQLDGLGRIERTGERPLIVVAENALAYVEMTQAGRTIKELIKELEQHYGGEIPVEPLPVVPSESLPSNPEILIFEGRDERLPFAFIAGAFALSGSVARLQVPCIVNGQVRENDYGFGTGWLVAPGLLFTNHHVIAARQPWEPAPSETDCQAQARGALAWFDYHSESGSRVEYSCVDLVCSNAGLDYALLRLTSSADLSKRQPLPIMHEPFTLLKGDRLNIIQYPRGGPLRYAIRNNFYLTAGDTPDRLRYLTDTEPGSSGSPVLNDLWKVVAIHHASRQIPPEQYKGEIIRYHNQGIAIHAILNHLPVTVRHEIEIAQGWR